MVKVIMNLNMSIKFPEIENPFSDIFIPSFDFSIREFYETTNKDVIESHSKKLNARLKALAYHPRT